MRTAVGRSMHESGRNCPPDCRQGRLRRSAHGSREGREVGAGREVEEVILALARGAVLADEPGLIARQMLLALA